jgi:uncharacterized protein (TIGR00369 family)
MSKPEIPAKVAPDLLERVRARFEPLPLIEGWELSIDGVGPGTALLHLVGGPKVHNTAGTVHGGALAAVADMACALALSTIFDGSMPFVTSDLHIRYLDPARGPVFAEAEVLRLSARGAVLECRLRCGARMAALCTTHFAIKAVRRTG